MTETRKGGPRSLAAMLPRIARPAFGRRGFAEAGVLTDWPQIVGPVLAAETRPVKLSFPRGGRTDGTLQIRVTSAFSTELQHLAPLVMERINRYFGYGAVQRLTFTQGPVIRPPRGRRPAEAEPDAAAIRRMERVDRDVAAVENTELRAALAGLGRRVVRREAGRKPARRPG